MKQHHPPTVGDTLTIVRHIAAPPGAVVQAAAPTDTTVATLVTPVVTTREGDSVRIAYTIAVWAPGHTDLVLPGAIVVDRRGQVDTLPDAHVALDVASVLPAGKAPSSIAPRSARHWLPAGNVSLLPFAFWLPLALLAVGVLQWWWRRRGPTAPPPPLAEAAPLTEERLNGWIAADEATLALDHIEQRVRDRSDFEGWRERAALVRFAPGRDGEIAGLVREAIDKLASTEAE